jgi:hypothetical protein
MVLDATLTSRLNYVLQSDLVSVRDTNEETGGVNQYLFYTLNDCLALGLRFEWLKDDLLGAGRGDAYALTGGVNYRPHANVMLRPEVRYDRSDDDVYDQTVFGMDAIVTF